MRIERIDTRRPTWTEDPKLTDYRLVRDPERVRVSDVFLVEGRTTVRTLLLDSPLTARSLLVTDTTLEWLEREFPDDASDLPVYVVSPSALRELSGYRFHQGCLAVGERPEPVPASETLRRVTAGNGIVVGLDRVTNPDNVGAIFRTSAAFGVDALLLSPECCSPLYRKAIRTSMGAALRLPYSHSGSWDAALESLRDADYVRLALTTRGRTAPLEAVLRDLGASRKIALLLGAEGDGLGAESLAASDQRVVIPMSAGMDCLNVAAAAAVALYCARPGA